LPEANLNRAGDGHLTASKRVARPLIDEVTIVAHDISSFGGMETALERLVHGLMNANFRVTLVARTWDFRPHPNLRWIRVPGPKRPFSLAYPWFFLLGSYKVWRHRRGLLHVTGAIVANRPDVVTVHLCHEAARRQLRRRSSRTSPLYRLNSLLGSRLSLAGERLIYRAGRMKAVVGVSSGVIEEVRRYYPGLRTKIRVIPNAVDQLRFRPDSRTRELVREQLGLNGRQLVGLFVGGDWERKGLWFAIEAVGKVPGVDLLVVGNGDRERFERLAAGCGAGGRVHFLGATDHPEAFFKAADVFILPTGYETFSLAAYEAAASQLALLVTCVSGVSDILEDGVCGWFVSQDSDEIASRLRQLKSDGGLRVRMGAAAQQAIQRFTWERVVHDYVDLYKNLVMADQPASGRVQSLFAESQEDPTTESSIS
jgi:glycosyltransferase involved in cell wall biosynthesis